MTLIDETGESTTQTWQAFGNPDAGRLVSIMDAANNTWRYAYDAVDRLRSVMAPDGTQRTWQYTPEGRLASETHPESGTVTFEAYDGRGLLTRKRDARGTVFEYAYDANGRPTSVAAGNRATRFGYEPGSDRRVWASLGYRDAVGAVLDPVETRWGYDAAGRLELRQDSLDGRTFSSWYTRDSVDNVTTLTYPSLENTARRQVQHGYDATGRRLIQLRDLGTSRVYASEFAYHPSGGLSRYRAGNNLLTQITYHPQRYWVQSIIAGPLALGYATYDDAGNLKTLTDSRAGHTQQFQYDRLHRLISAAGAYGSQTFAYDVHGNRASVPGLVAYLYDAASLRLMARDGITFSYDANGNLKTEPGRAYDYTVDNLVETATVNGVAVTYRYDADGWRIATTIGGTTTYSLRGPSNELLTEWTTPGPTGTVKDYIHAGNRLVSVVATAVASTSIPTGVLTVGGSPATVALAQGQDARYSFAGATAQVVQVQLTSVTPSGCNWTLAILTLTGSPLATTPCVGTTGTVSATLPAAGVYTVWVHPAAGVGGTVTLVVTNVTNGAPVITAFAPTVAGPGAAVTIQGSGLAGAVNVRFNTIDAGVTSATPTGLTTTVPAEALSGRLVVTTSNGTATSTNDFFVPPAPFSAAQLAVSGRLALGVPRTVTLSAPGTIALLLLDRVAGQRFLTTGTSPGSVLHHVTILRPDGGILMPRGPWYSPSTMHDALTAPTTGTYTFLIETDATYLGAKTYTVFDVPADATGTISATCTPVSMSSLAAGQNARLTMYGTAGQRVAMVVDAKTITALGATLTASDGSVVWYDPIYNPSAEAYDIVTLPLTGSYSLLLNPWYDYSGTITWRICDVPPDQVVPATADGVDVAVTVTAPYQNGTVRFTVAAGQHITVTTPVSTFPAGSVYVRLYAPSGVHVESLVASSSMFLDVTLAEAGAYTLLIDPIATATGTLTVRVNTINDLSGAIVAGGSAATVTTSVPRQNATLTFAGTAGQKVALAASGGTFGGTSSCDAYMRVLKPDDAVLAANTCAEVTGFIDATTLPVTGTYKVVLDPQGVATGTVTLRLYNAADVTGSLSSGTAKIISTGVGQNALYTFSANSGGRLSLKTTAASYGADCNAYLRVVKPDGSTLVSNLCAGAAAIFVDAMTLTDSGTYAVVIDPVGPNAGSVTLTRYAVPSDPSPTIAVNQPPLTVSTTVPGQNAQPKFVGTANQPVTVRLSSSSLSALTVSLIHPNGGTLLSLQTSAAAFNLPSHTLPVNGTYKIRIDPAGPITGSVGVQVTTP